MAESQASQEENDPKETEEVVEEADNHQDQDEPKQSKDANGPEQTDTIEENESDNKHDAEETKSNDNNNDNESKPEKKERTKLISKELLTDEQIKEAGIDGDEVNLYRMKKFKEAFTLDKWINIPQLHSITFDTRIIPVSPSEANSFLVYCRYTQSKLTKGKDVYTKVVEDYKENQEKIEGDINSLKQKINEAVEEAKWTECGFFAKFNSRSPKDVHEYDGNKEYVTNVFFPEMDKFKAKLKSIKTENKDNDDDKEPVVEINEALIASYCARAKLLKMMNGDDVIDTFSRSFRSLEDLAGTLRLGDEHMDISIALRKWHDGVPTNGHGEFRCFVHDGKLNAITQYISCIWFKGLDRQKEEIKDRILKFYEEKVKDYVPMDSFVIDFLVLGIKLDDEHNVYGDDNNEEEKKQQDDDGIYIIEFNPFYKSAGAGLFDWRVDRELFLNGPCEIRVLDHLDPKGADYFHPSWVKSYEKYTGVDIRPKHTKKVEAPKKKKNCVIL